ncbi:hypothetical protein [Dialister succinatiphilus]|uniref:hypothetical protein n=1 Tax=Dialister succinatiphilus TaxID=487173 RepID=UPI003F7FD037
MLIIRNDIGSIITDPQRIYADYTNLVIKIVPILFAKFAWDFTSEAITTHRLPSKKVVRLTLDWIFERMEHQRANPNIVVDVNKCPFLTVKEDVQDEGASIEELRF